jgi:hypothetical protein
MYEIDRGIKIISYFEWYCRVQVWIKARVFGPRCPETRFTKKPERIILSGRVLSLVKGHAALHELWILFDGPCLRTLSSASNVMLFAPGEPEDREIIVRALVLDASEVISQIAISHKKGQPSAFIAIAILIQDLSSVHGTLLRPQVVNLGPACKVKPKHR